MTPFELTKQLMSIPSISGDEAEVGEYLSAYLTAAGYRIHRQVVENKRFNVLAFTTRDPKVVFCTHIDTVPPQLPIAEDDECLYGRGACDTKGIVAAMLDAGARLRSSGIEEFAFLFVVGEEVNGIGARTANRLKWTSEFVIVGEPTQNLMARAQKGTLNANLKFQ